MQIMINRTSGKLEKKQPSITSIATLKIITRHKGVSQLPYTFVSRDKV